MVRQKKENKLPVTSPPCLYSKQIMGNDEVTASVYSIHYIV